MNKKSLFLFLVAYLVLLTLAQLPIWLNDFVPLQDYPNHLARMYILMNWQGDPFLQEYYRLNWAILPNLAMDIIVPILAKFLGLEWAGKSMIVLTLFALTSGCIFLNYALFNKISYWSLTSFIILFNQAFIKGFLNFLFGIGLALWCIGLWIILKKYKARLRVLIFSILSTLLFICHLYALGFYAVVVFFYEFSFLIKRRDNFHVSNFKEILILSSSLLLPGVLYFLSPTSAGEVVLNYTPLLTKLKYIKMKISDNYNPLLDWVTVAFLILIPGWGLWRKKLKFSKSMTLSIAALVAIYFCIPGNIATSKNSDWRILIPLFFSIFSSLQFRSDRLFNAVVSVLFTFIFLVHVSLMNLNFNAVQSEYREIHTAINFVDKGSRIFPARGSLNYYENLPFMHAPTYAVIQKSSFIPSLFAFESQQPVQFSPDYLNLAQATGQAVYSHGRGIDWQSILKHYDYILIARENLFADRDIPKSSLQQVFKGQYITLYKISNRL